MIYLFAGDDTKKKVATYEKFLSSLSKDNEVFYINKNDFNKNQIENFYKSTGLFFTKCTVVFSDVLENEEYMDFLFSKLIEFAESINDFIFIEGKLSKALLDKFKKARTDINYFELPKEKKEKFNNFLLADAFGSRDKFNLWLYFRQAMDVDVGLEELVGILFWKVKDMILKKNFSKYTKEELQNIGNKISYILPKARKEGRDDKAALEQFLLEIF